MQVLGPLFLDLCAGVPAPTRPDNNNSGRFAINKARANILNGGIPIAILIGTLVLFFLLVSIATREAFPGRKSREEFDYLLNHKLRFDFYNIAPLLGALGICFPLFNLCVNFFHLTLADEGAVAKALALSGAAVVSWAVLQCLAIRLMLSESLDKAVLIRDENEKEITTSGIAVITIRISLLYGLLGVGLSIAGFALESAI